MSRAAPSPFETNQDTGLYFWRSGSDGDETQLSNRSHALLPIHCLVHRWWMNRPCPACRVETRDSTMPLPTPPRPMNPKDQLFELALQLERAVQAKAIQQTNPLRAHQLIRLVVSPSTSTITLVLLRPTKTWRPLIQAVRDAFPLPPGVRLVTHPPDGAPAQLTPADLE